MRKNVILPGPLFLPVIEDPFDPVVGNRGSPVLGLSLEVVRIKVHDVAPVHAGEVVPGAAVNIPYLHFIEGIPRIVKELQE